MNLDRLAEIVLDPGIPPLLIYACVFLSCIIESFFPPWPTDVLVLYADVPLLTIEGNRVALTAEGVLVLAGDADFAALNGLDRWVGGTHLTGKTPRWRWNPERGVIVHGPSQ